MLLFFLWWLMARKPIPLTDGPMWSAGDAALIPDGYSRLKKNLLQRPLRWEKRPPWVYDNEKDSTAANSKIGYFSLWEDARNNATRLVAGRYDGTDFRIDAKATTGETWASTTVAANVGSLIADSASYRGILYWLQAFTTFKIHSWDGTTVTGTGAEPFDVFAPNVFGITQLRATSLCVYKERLIMGRAQVGQVNLLTSFGGGAAGYNLAATWTLTGVTASNVSTGAGITCRLTPTVTTGTAKAELADVFGFQGHGFDQFGHLLAQPPYVDLVRDAASARPIACRSRQKSM